MLRNSNNQKRIALTGALVLGTALVALPAMAANDTQHLRGQITAVSDSGFTMTTQSGDKRQIKLSSKTQIATATKGDLSNIEKGTFIGTANVEKNGENRALEMVIFPPSMKGTGLGDYSWDLSPSMVGQPAGGSQTAGGSMTSGSSMTNGTVSSKSGDSMTSGSSMTNGTVSSKTSDSGSSMASGSSMTNGTVSSKTSGGSGSSMASGSSMTNGTVTQSSGGNQSITLTVDYGKGSKKIVVPADVPTVKLQPGSKDDLKSGAHVFVAGPQTSGAFNAKKIIVGKNGTVPPM